MRLIPRTNGSRQVRALCQEQKRRCIDYHDRNPLRYCMLIKTDRPLHAETTEEVEHLDIPAESSPTPAHPIRVRSRPVPAGVRIARHTHAWAQVACTTRGVLRIAAEGSTWMVPPSRAIWVPPNVTHEVVIVEDAFLRTLYI